MFVATVVLVILSVLSRTDAAYENKFEVTEGCLQYNSDRGYNFAHAYFSTGAFTNVRKNAGNSTELRIGVLGRNDGFIRLAPVQYPYDGNYMNEIVISGWENTRTQVRSYTRTGPAKTDGFKVLREQSSLGLLSEFEPLMFTLSINPNGAVKLTKDGDSYPFLEFQDTKVSSMFISFCNWNVPVVYFFDCPHKK
ncbi:hypothetical protein pipiens_014484 [Culex pipiens pipiens]|uniref:Farnesoic acid O-methyl transferase domain-containing protein n=2 Tax=Culex pipiens TaxID=7175 RepID=A0ABD1CUE7_CULPP